jgi:hypothetical protein
VGRPRPGPLRLGSSVQSDGLGDREDRETRAKTPETEDRRSPLDYGGQYQAAAQDELNFESRSVIRTIVVTRRIGNASLS